MDSVDLLSWCSCEIWYIHGSSSAVSLHCVCKYTWHLVRVVVFVLRTNLLLIKCMTVFMINVPSKCFQICPFMIDWIYLLNLSIASQQNFWFTRHYCTINTNDQFYHHTQHTTSAIIINLKFELNLIKFEFNQIWNEFNRMCDFASARIN